MLWGTEKKTGHGRDTPLVENAGWTELVLIPWNNNLERVRTSLLNNDGRGHANMRSRRTRTSRRTEEDVSPYSVSPLLPRTRLGVPPRPGLPCRSVLRIRPSRAALPMRANTGRSSVLSQLPGRAGPSAPVRLLTPPPSSLLFFSVPVVVPQLRRGQAHSRPAFLRWFASPPPTRDPSAVFHPP